MSSPRSIFPERSRWTRLLGMDGLALSDWQRLFTPKTHTHTHTVTQTHSLSIITAFKTPVDILTAQWRKRKRKWRVGEERKERDQNRKVCKCNALPSPEWACPPLYIIRIYKKQTKWSTKTALSSKPCEVLQRFHDQYALKEKPYRCMSGFLWQSVQPNSDIRSLLCVFSVVCLTHITVTFTLSRPVWFSACKSKHPVKWLLWSSKRY